MEPRVGDEDVHPAKPIKERERTDASLLAERTKTDAELEKKRQLLEEDEDRVVAVARDRAEETLDAARDRADRDLTAQGVTAKMQRNIQVERADADEAVMRERAVADELLRAERENRQRALTALLSLEREATDDGLVVERSRADEIVATRDDFLAMVSHDLRNMLSTVAISATMLTKLAASEGDGGAETMRHADRIQRGAAQMNRLVADLLDVVSLDAGTLRVTLQPDDAVRVVKEAADAFQPIFSDTGVTLIAEHVEGSIVARLDRDRILQVLANLLTNALKFTRRGGQVALSLAREESEMRFSVVDTGIGIPLDQHAAIFERFGQVTRDRRGHGLGLYIARGIVEAHGGRIWAESPPGGGTALHFTLPSAT